MLAETHTIALHFFLITLPYMSFSGISRYKNCSCYLVFVHLFTKHKCFEEINTTVSYLLDQFRLKLPIFHYCSNIFSKMGIIYARLAFFHFIFTHRKEKRKIPL